MPRRYSPTDGRGRDGRARPSARNPRARREGPSRTRRPSRSSYDERDESAFASASTFLIRLVCVLALFLCGKLVWLQVFDAGRLSAMAEERSTNSVTLTARRGTIYDRRGHVLAASEDCSTLYCNPTEIEDEASVASILARHLGGKAGDFHKALSADTTFAYVAKRVDSSKAEALLAELSDAGLTGIYELPDVRRVYPYGDVAGQVLGLVGEDGHGLTGLELYYDDVLGGQDGSRIMEVGLGGIPVAGGAYRETAATDGEDIVISLDVEIQAAAERALSTSYTRYGASEAMACIMDPETGEIYAIASTPLLPAGDGSEAAPESLNLGLLTQSYEPGSVSKVLTTAIGLETGAFDADSVWNVPWSKASGDYFVTDDDNRGWNMDMDPREILRRSSNVGAMVEAEEIGGLTLLQGLRSFGIGEPTGIDFPGEAEGILHDVDQWDGGTMYSLAFGQGYSAPPIQIVRAVAAIANHGILVTPHFLCYRGGERVEWPGTRRVCTPQTATAVAEMMQAVVDEGTASEAAIEGFDVAGKTGTAQKADLEHGGYLEGEVFSSFVGFTGVPNADLLGYVGVDGGYLHGGESAAPIFSELMGEALHDLSITPNAREGADGSLGVPGYAYAPDLYDGDGFDYEVYPEADPDADAPEDVEAPDARSEDDGSGHATYGAGEGSSENGVGATGPGDGEG